jgi:arginine exporter protein ArgO
MTECNHDHRCPCALAGPPKRILPAAGPPAGSCTVLPTVISDFLSGAVAGLAVAMPVGAVGSYLVGLAARERIPVATAAALGVASVDGGYAIIATLSGAGLETLITDVSGWPTCVAAILLAAVAVRTLQLAVRRYRGTNGTVGQPRGLTPARAYFSLVALTALNPATMITFAAVVMGRSLDGGSSCPAVAWFVIGAFVASAVWQLLLTGGANLLGRVLSGRRGQLGISACSALIMLGLAVGVLLS